jgi:ubiquinone/menaquinone biosynthesis C-methylase UbiE
MGIYEERILPHVVHVSMQQEMFLPYRGRVASGARGRVLEIGVGSGLNLSLYGAAVDRVIGLDRSPKLIEMATRRPLGGGVRADFIHATGESIPLETASIDTVVTTWTLCSISDVEGALREMHRVLKPFGELRFVEHGRAPDGGVERWQNWLTPMWKRLAGGCHLNRPVRELVEAAGFRIDRVETGYMKGPKPLTFMYEGSARPTR